MTFAIYKIYTKIQVSNVRRFLEVIKALVSVPSVRCFSVNIFINNFTFYKSVQGASVYYAVSSLYLYIAYTLSKFNVKVLLLN